MRSTFVTTGGTSFVLAGVEWGWNVVLLITLVSLGYALWRLVPAPRLVAPDIARATTPGTMVPSPIPAESNTVIDLRSIAGSATLIESGRH
jgi:hypothetical protein